MSNHANANGRMAMTLNDYKYNDMIWMNEWMNKYRDSTLSEMKELTMADYISFFLDLKARPYCCKFVTKQDQHVVPKQNTCNFTDQTNYDPPYCLHQTTSTAAVFLYSKQFQIDFLDFYNISIPLDKNSIRQIKY